MLIETPVISWKSLIILCEITILNWYLYIALVSIILIKVTKQKMYNKNLYGILSVTFYSGTQTIKFVLFVVALTLETRK